jgi:hypothetical protein
VLLLQSTDGIGIDISLAALPFERDIIQRSSLFTFLPDAALRTCSAEDLVVLKAFASRPQDWVDIRGVLVRQGDVFDRSVVREQLVILAELKEDPSILSALDEVYAQVS